MHTSSIRYAPMPNGGAPDQSGTEQTAAELRHQEREFYEALLPILADMPAGTTVAGALATPAGERARRKWTLKYRPPPLQPSPYAVGYCGRQTVK